MSEGNDKDEIGFSIGKEGLSVKLKGEPASKTGRGFGDLLKPLIHFVGEKGDALEHKRKVKKLIRIFNEEAVRLSLSTALEESKKLGVLPQPLPIKFLVNWSEGASLESPEDPENLINMWAKLLVSEMVEENPNSVFYAGLIKQMTRTHADFFEGICKGQPSGFFAKQKSKISEDRITDIVLNVVQEYECSGIPDDVVNELANKLRSSLDVPNLHVFSCFVSSASSNPPVIDLDFTARPIPRYSIARESLESLGLVAQNFMYETVGHFSIECHYVTLTDLGMDFVLSCVANKQEITK